MDTNYKITYLFLQEPVSFSVHYFFYSPKSISDFIIYFTPFKCSTEYTIIKSHLSFLYNAPVLFSLGFTNTD